ncbi:unnamed protein product [Rotaria sp. Silwood1]|nr:unnamed protein product [Rotaria sp. Silwood1]CAF4917447.1 unnamed protein product [Rotaria sp. Silwood1]
MGIFASQDRLRRPFSAFERKRNFQRCSTDNSNSLYPEHRMNAQNNSNMVKTQSTFRSAALWCCDLCLSENQHSLQHCIFCGKERVKPNKRDHYSPHARIMSAMETESIAVRDHHEMDEFNIEKISRDVIAYCQRHNMAFVDDQFPPSDRSLGISHNDHTIQWLPLSKIAPSTHLDDYLPWTIYDLPDPSDIHQGKLGDCWLMAALALITERPQMLQHILLTKKVNREGVYVVRICHNGIWTAVLLDSYFPCTFDSELAYSRAAHRQLYVSLIEKACAKLFGSCGSLSEGSMAEGLQLLTGAPCDHINLHPIDETLDFDIVWAKLLSACESKLLIGISTSCSEIDQQAYKDAGLNPNHAFTVLAAKTLPVDDGRFLLVRDPHGTSNYSEESITPLMRTYLRAMYDQMPNSSGIFWISWFSFLRFFQSITISTYVSTHFDIREEIQFTRSPIDKVPAYYFVVAKTSLITVSLIYHRRVRKEKSRHTQSFVICNIEEDRSDVGTKEVIFLSRRGTFTYWTGTLPPGAYVIIPFSVSLWKTNNIRNNERTRSCTLAIHSSIRLDGALLEEPSTLLADCIIAAVIKYCDKPKYVCSIIFFLFYLCIFLLYLLE